MLIGLVLPAISLHYVGLTPKVGKLYRHYTIALNNLHMYTQCI